MIRTITAVMLFLHGSTNDAPAQSTSAHHSPKREVRAVWVTTAAGLDWPHTTDRADQQASLRSMVRDLCDARFNTIFFQVRARGDAYYRSSYEPWAENLTGTLGKDPGWDPLAFLLTEAHRRGIEVHAWFNVYKIKGPNGIARSAPLHPALTLARSMVTVDGEGWLDPGVPEVRAYLLRVALDLIQHYAVDGINFDFMRYPGRTFPDDNSYGRYGHGMERDEWRRNNVTQFVKEFYTRASALAPMLKIGSSPLGAYDGDAATGVLGSYSNFYQDSQGWLRVGIQDYVAPQLYWTIGESRSDPDFALLARSWQSRSSGRQIIAGIGAYKSEILQEIPAEIDSARAAGLVGQAFFRYDTIRRLDMFRGWYATLAVAPPMPWKDSIPPLAPTHLAVSEITPNVYHLEWSPPAPASDGDRACRYMIYRGITPRIPFDDPSCLVAVTAAESTFAIDTVTIPAGITYYYAVSALDKGNNESVPSALGAAAVREVLTLRETPPARALLSTSVSSSGGVPTLLAYRLPSRSMVVLDVIRADDDTGSASMVTLVRQVQDEGTYVVGLGGIPFHPGRYLIRLTAGSGAVEQAIDVRE